MTGKFGAALSKLKKADEPETQKTRKEEGGDSGEPENGKPRKRDNVAEAVGQPESLKTRKEENGDAGEPENRNTGEQRDSPSASGPENLKSGKEERRGSGEPENQNVGIPEEREDSRRQPENLKTRKEESGKTSQPENRKTRTQEHRPAAAPASPVPEPTESLREKYSTILDRDLVTRLKMYAVRNRLKDREVVEAALRAYLPED